MAQRKVTIIPKTAYGLRSGAEKWHVNTLPRSKAQKRELLILGTGRSGTSMLSKMFQMAGYDLRHEKVGAFGTCSLFFNVDSEWYPRFPWTEESAHAGERRSDFKFKHIFHVVRNPLNTIPSMTGIFPQLNYEFFADNGIIEHGLKPALRKCAHVYYGLNSLADQQAEWRFRIEDMNQSLWDKMMARLNLPKCEMPIAPRGRSSGFRRRPPTTWRELKKLAPEIYDELRLMAAVYGYK